MKAGNGMRDKMERRKSEKNERIKGSEREGGEGGLPLGRQESPTRFMDLSAEKQ